MQGGRREGRMKRPTFCAQRVDLLMVGVVDLPGTLGCSYTVGGVGFEDSEKEVRNWAKTDCILEGRC